MMNPGVRVQGVWWSVWPLTWLVCVTMLICLPWRAAQAEDFLPPEQAFQVSLTVQDAQCKTSCLVDVSIEVTPRYYLYAERFKLEKLAGLKSLEFVSIPKGERKFDENLAMEIEALRGSLNFQVRYEPELTASGVFDPQSVKGNLVSQGCADAGLCYPPMTTPLPFASKSGLLDRASALLGGAGPMTGKVGVDTAGTTQASAALEAQKPSGPGGLDEASGLALRLQSQPFWIVLPVFFGLGLLLAFTPCTLPMLPIVTSLVLGSRAEPGQATDPSRADKGSSLGSSGSSAASATQPIRLALMYVLGMALTYSILGVLAGLSGQSLVVALQQPPVLWSFGALLAALGVALLLGYSLQMPASVQGWIQARTQNLQGGQYVPVLVMGVLSALLLGPCVAPPLAGALLYIGQTGNALLGGAALFLLALGMGLPMVILAGGAGRLLPKSGHWMNWVSVAFGFILLAVAIWIVSPVTPVSVLMGMWLLLAALVSAACFEGVASRQLKSVIANVLFRAVGLLSALVALVYLMGVLSGAGSVLKPLAGLSVTQGEVIGAGSPGAPVSKHAGPPFEPVLSADVAAVIASAGQPVLLDFYADWCVACKEFELLTLTDVGVQQRLKGIRLLRVDVTLNSPSDQALMKQYALFGPPALLFFNALGEEQKAQRVVGFQNAEKFSATLDEVRPLLF